MAPEKNLDTLSPLQVEQFYRGKFISKEQETQGDFAILACSDGLKPALASKLFSPHVQAGVLAPNSKAEDFVSGLTLSYSPEGYLASWGELSPVLDRGHALVQYHVFKLPLTAYFQPLGLYEWVRGQHEAGRTFEKFSQLPTLTFTPTPPRPEDDKKRRADMADFLAPFNASNSEVFWSLLDVLCAGETLYIVHAPPDIEKRLTLLEHVCLALPSALRPALSFCTHLRDINSLPAVQVKFLEPHLTPPAGARVYLWDKGQLNAAPAPSLYRRCLQIANFDLPTPNEDAPPLKDLLYQAAPPAFASLAEDLHLKALAYYLEKPGLFNAQDVSAFLQDLYAVYDQPQAATQSLLIKFLNELTQQVEVISRLNNADLASDFFEFMVRLEDKEDLESVFARLRLYPHYIELLPKAWQPILKALLAPNQNREEVQEKHWENLSGFESKVRWSLIICAWGWGFKVSERFWNKTLADIQRDPALLYKLGHLWQALDYTLPLEIGCTVLAQAANHPHANAAYKNKLYQKLLQQVAERQGGAVFNEVEQVQNAYLQATYGLYTPFVHPQLNTFLQFWGQLLELAKTGEALPSALMKTLEQVNKSKLSDTYQRLLHTLRSLQSGGFLRGEDKEAKAALELLRDLSKQLR